MVLTMNPRNRLRRNLQRRRLGGVCSGIADYLGVSVTLVRFLVVISVFFSFSLTLWIYLALWFLLPAEAETPMPNLSWGLRRQLKRIEQLVRQAHRRLDADLADQIQAIFDAIKLVAPGFEGESRGSSYLGRTREQALQRFPKILEQLLALPAALAENRNGEMQDTPYGLLRGELRQINDQLDSAGIEVINSRIRRELGEVSAHSPEVEAWKSQLAALQHRLSERAGAQTLAKLEHIEEKLVFLLNRTRDTQGLFDLNPFQVRKIAYEYLPDALDQYLRLPPAMARSQRLTDGKTAEEALNEQMNLLDHTLQDMAKSLYENDAQGLLIHGRFLKEKFAEQPFRLSD
jgi:phage shock protein PspC (stress-responsive transcriptional regulator)